MVPDWPEVAQEYDAVHLTVSGYLTTAGRAVPVSDGVASVLAGWGPDETWWLTDVRGDGGGEARAQGWVRRETGWTTDPDAEV